MVAGGLELVFQNDDVLVAEADDHVDLNARLFESLRRRIRNRAANAAADHANALFALDVGGLTKRAHEVLNVVALVEAAEQLRGQTDLLEDDCYRALFAVVARDRQRYALGFVIDAENDELTGFRLFGNERSFDLHVRHRGIEFLFARNFVHFFHPFNMNHTFPRKVPYSRIITRTLLSCKPYSLYFYGFAITIFSFRTIRHENSFASSSVRTASL